ncbi:hypothetical protein BDZ89DRAFT_157404 [Hymenopellis radicata]|nr:hypothetical protein BDZ89DRAFT_157404 [Hymenopellis radicata]
MKIEYVDDVVPPPSPTAFEGSPPFARTSNSANLQNHIVPLRCYVPPPDGQQQQVSPPPVPTESERRRRRRVDPCFRLNARASHPLRITTILACPAAESPSSSFRLGTRTC